MEINVLILQGKVEIIQSKKTGQAYATAHKVTMPCTFDEKTAKALIGTTLPGTVVKEACEPYDYTIPETQEVVQLDYTYKYSSETVSMEEAAFAL